jgi:tetratricopeptide (TPR) repeat protein
MAAAQRLYDECLELARQGTDRGALALALYNASFPRVVESTDLPRAEILIGEALAIYRELNDLPSLAQGLWALGNLYYFQLRNEEAAAPLDEAIARFRALGQRFGLGWALHTRTLVALKLSQLDLADSFWREGMVLFDEAGDPTGLVLLLTDAAEAALARGESERAYRLAGAATALSVRIGTNLNDVAQAQVGRKWSDQIETESERRAWEEGAAMTMDQAVVQALGSGAELSQAQ